MIYIYIYDIYIPYPCLCLFDILVCCAVPELSHAITIASGKAATVVSLFSHVHLWVDAWILFSHPKFVGYMHCSLIISP